jgi:hypothetical protein
VNFLASFSLAFSSRPARPATASRKVIVRAQNTDTEERKVGIDLDDRRAALLPRSHALTLSFSVRQLDFTPSARSGLGFTSDDSAGQSNIFAVEPKQYVSDSNTSSNVGGPAIAGAVAVGLIVAGIRILTTGEAELVVGGPDAGLKTLGAYAEMFAVKEVAAPVAAMEEAPELN